MFLKSKFKYQYDFDDIFIFYSYNLNDLEREIFSDSLSHIPSSFIAIFNSRMC